MEGNCEFQWCELVRIMSPASMLGWSHGPTVRPAHSCPTTPGCALCKQTAAEPFHEGTEDPEELVPHWIPEVEAVCEGGGLPLFPQTRQPRFAQVRYCSTGGRLACGQHRDGH